MTDEQFHFIVEEVIRRLAGRMGEPRRNESLIVVFTGATVGLVEVSGRFDPSFWMGFRSNWSFPGRPGIFLPRWSKSS